MKMVGLGKLKRESMADRTSQGPEEQPVQEEVDAVKPREPLSGKNHKDTTHFHFYQPTHMELIIVCVDQVQN